MALDREFDFYLQHQKELSQKYPGRVVVIVGDAVIGSYSSEAEAVSETSKDRPVGTFLVQRCDPSGDSVRQTFHSRVAFHSRVSFA
jgi:hypothetical protein